MPLNFMYYYLLLSLSSYYIFSMLLLKCFYVVLLFWHFTKDNYMTIRKAFCSMSINSFHGNSDLSSFQSSLFPWCIPGPCPQCQPSKCTLKPTLNDRKFCLGGWGHIAPHFRKHKGLLAENFVLVCTVGKKFCTLPKRSVLGGCKLGAWGQVL